VLFELPFFIMHHSDTKGKKTISSEEELVEWGARKRSKLYFSVKQLGLSISSLGTIVRNCNNIEYNANQFGIQYFHMYKPCVTWCRSVSIVSDMRLDDWGLIPVRGKGFFL
jgi:hypothetical protein